MKISLIAAVAQNGMIGRNRPDGTPDLPWHLPDDFAFFKRKTSHHPIIMGRKSMDALGKPLPNRTNIVISRRADYAMPGAISVSTLDDALAEARKTDTDEIFVIGGAEIYALALPVATTLYLTEIHRDYDGDTRFPDFDRSQWRETARVPHPADDRHEAAFDLVTYERAYKERYALLVQLAIRLILPISRICSWKVVISLWQSHYSFYSFC